MPSYVIPEKCDGCKDLDKTACQYICPNDLMLLNKEINKAYNQEPDMCWECYNCLKMCPVDAVVIRGYSDFVPMGASVTPMKGTDEIMWTVQFRNGKVKRFKFPIRTKPEGSIELPDLGNNKDDLKGLLLYSEPEGIGVSELPTLKK